MLRRFTSLWFVNFGGRNAVEPDRYVSNLDGVAVAYMRDSACKLGLSRSRRDQQDDEQDNGQALHARSLL